MKKFALVLAGVMFIAGMVGSASAQVAVDETVQPQRQAVRTIFSYRQELNLTEAQEKEITDTLLNLQKELINKRAQLSVAQIELRQMIGDRADLDAIRNKINQVVTLSGDITYTDVAASRTIENVLSREQLDKWRAIQVAARQGQ